MRARRTAPRRRPRRAARARRTGSRRRLAHGCRRAAHLRGVRPPRAARADRAKARSRAGASAAWRSRARWRGWNSQLSVAPVDRGGLAPADAALEPVGSRLIEGRVVAQVGEQGIERGVVGGRAAERHQRRADACRRERHRRLEGHRDPEVRQDAGEHRPRGVRVANDDRDLVWLVAVGEQAGDLDPDCLGLASRPG